MKPANLGRINGLADGLTQCVPGNRIFMKGEKAVRHGDVNILPDSLSISYIQSRYDSQSGMNASHGIADGHGRYLELFALGGPTAGHLGDQVISRLMTVGPPVTEA